jgi:hypothetical protein
MCNQCECENEDLCSIKGYQPYGFCCEYCSQHDEEHSCVSYQIEMPKIKTIITEEEFETIPQKSISLYP